MLLTIEKGIGDRICHAILWNAETNKKYMKDYEKNKKLLHLMLRDANDLHG